MPRATTKRRAGAKGTTNRRGEERAQEPKAPAPKTLRAKSARKERTRGKPMTRNGANHRGRDIKTTPTTEQSKPRNNGSTNRRNSLEPRDESFMCAAGQSPHHARKLGTLQGYVDRSALTRGLADKGSVLRPAAFADCVGDDSSSEHPTRSGLSGHSPRRRWCDGACPLCKAPRSATLLIRRPCPPASWGGADHRRVRPRRCGRGQADKQRCAA